MPSLCVCFVCLFHFPPLSVISCKTYKDTKGKEMGMDLRLFQPSQPKPSSYRFIAVSRPHGPRVNGGTTQGEKETAGAVL